MEFTVRATLGTIDVANVTHWHIAGGDNDPDHLLDELWGTTSHAFKDAWLLSHSSGNYTARTLYCREVWREGVGFSSAAPVERSITAAGTNADSGDILPSGICQIATLYTPLAGRKWRGRMHFGSGREGSISGQTFDGSTGGLYDKRTLLFSAVLLPLYGVDGTHDFTIGVYSKTAARGTPTVLSDVFQPLTNYRVRPEVHWLRSRAT